MSSRPSPEGLGDQSGFSKSHLGGARCPTGETADIGQHAGWHLGGGRYLPVEAPDLRYPTGGLVRRSANLAEVQGGGGAWEQEVRLGKIKEHLVNRAVTAVT